MSFSLLASVRQNGLSPFLSASAIRNSSTRSGGLLSTQPLTMSVGVAFAPNLPPYARPESMTGLGVGLLAHSAIVAVSETPASVAKDVQLLSPNESCLTKIASTNSWNLLNAFAHSTAFPAGDANRCCDRGK